MLTQGYANVEAEARTKKCVFLVEMFQNVTRNVSNWSSKFDYLASVENMYGLGD